MRSRFPLALVLVAALVGLAPPADAETTPGLDGARRRANDAAGRVEQLEAELGGLDTELARLETERRSAEVELERLQAEVRRVAVDRYTHAGDDDPLLIATDLNASERARALVRIVTQDDQDAVDRYAVTKDRLERTTAVLAQRRADQAKRLDALGKEQERLSDELDRLERLEAQRLETERREAEAVARQADDAAARQRADQLRALADARAAGKAGGGGDPGAPRQVASGDWVCPVQGPHTFRDSWGDARSGGRSHKGTDIMAPRGTPVVNPVSGNVSTKGDALGGLSFHVQGDDGNYYYGTHLDSYSGATGHLPAGTVVGYVGDTGNAQGTHLHFEIHIGGYGNPVNPYPTVAKYC